MFLFSRDPLQVPPPQALQALVAAHAQTAAQTMICTFNFPKDYVFIFKDVCLLLFDLNKVEDNGIQMKYISTLILHSFQVLWQEQIQLQSEAHLGLSDSHPDLTALSAAVKCSWSLCREHSFPQEGGGKA